MEKVRKFGIISKGVFYATVGILTILAAIGIGGKVSGKNGVINFLQEQTFGSIILVILAVGLLLYTIYRIFSAFTSNNSDDDSSEVLKRIGYFVSGLIYGALAVSILTSVGSSSSGGSNSKQNLAQTVLSQDWGDIAMYILAAILVGVGIYQFYKGYSGKFMEKFNNYGTVESTDLLKKSGKYGLIARGFSFFIFAWFVAVAAYENNSDAVRGIGGMFDFLRGFSWGNILMGLMALGFVLYGIFQYFLARYSSLYSEN